MNTMTTDPHEDDGPWEPSDELVRELADRTAAAFGNSARLSEIGLLIGDWPEANSLSDGDQETLAHEIRDELAARDNGRRR